MITICVVVTVLIEAYLIRVLLTYCHASHEHYSLIDHIFVSSDILSLVNKYTIVSDGANVFDHLPVQFDIYCSFTR